MRPCRVFKKGVNGLGYYDDWRRRTDDETARVTTTAELTAVRWAAGETWRARVNSQELQTLHT